jgi:hypothetical protein
LIALVILPPAAILIAFKMSRWAMPLRVFATLFVIALHTTLFLGGAALIVDVSRHSWITD